MIYCTSTPSMIEVVARLNEKGLFFEVENWHDDDWKWIITLRSI
jgi:hypothetical protein